MSMEPDSAPAAPELEHVFVLPEYRRRRVSAGLILKAEETWGCRGHHDNRLSLDGGRLVRGRGIRKLQLSVTRITKNNTEGSGVRPLLIVANHAREGIAKTATAGGGKVQDAPTRENGEGS